MNNENNFQEPNAKKSKPAFFDTVANMVVKFLPIITVVFVALAVLSFFYEGIYGIANAIEACFYKPFSFGTVVRALFNGLENGITDIARYAFYAVITACFSKILNKR